jgi:hypothetical protein
MELVANSKRKIKAMHHYVLEWLNVMLLACLVVLIGLLLYLVSIDSILRSNRVELDDLQLLVVRHRTILHSHRMGIFQIQVQSYSVLSSDLLKKLG